ncbi:MAG: CBS domain-containing protein [Bacteriovoracaceae bacterium]|jgi:CBS domain-containing membrane protein|nr:CBS domain-containing protein [Bacteriovoracaceae bacterium]
MIANDLEISKLMTADIFTLNESDTVDIAEEVMGWRTIRHIPIVDDDQRLVGLLTHRDILKCSISMIAGISKETQRKLNHVIKIKEVMNTEPRSIPQNTLVRDAAKILVENKFGCLPIVDGEKLVGIVTEADFVKAFIKD